MPDLGLDVLLKGNNMIRLLQGMWVALQISLISIVISMPRGILVGALMTMKNKIVRAIFRIYLEIIRIIPQLVLLFIVYFGSTRALDGVCREKLLQLSYLYCGEPQKWEIW